MAVGTQMMTTEELLAMPEDGVDRADPGRTEGDACDHARTPALPSYYKTGLLASPLAGSSAVTTREGLYRRPPSPTSTAGGTGALVSDFDGGWHGCPSGCH